MVVLKVATLLPALLLLAAADLSPDESTPASGEQFIALRRDTNSIDKDWCAGCPTNIDRNAEGVSDLAALAVRHIDKHKPTEKHMLRNILQVQRQAMIVNGVRYILLLEVDSIPKNADESQNSVTSVCQITFLEKPWLKLRDGSKFRAALSNNCTDEYLFGDDGEVVDEDFNNTIDGSNGEISKVVYNNDLQSAPKPAVELTEERLKEIQEQIITESDVTQTEEEIAQQVANVETVERKIIPEAENSNTDVIEESDVTTTVVSQLSDAKKAVFDEFLDFLNFDEAKSTTKRNTKVTADSNSSESKENVKKEKIKKPESSEESAEEVKTKPTDQLLVKKPDSSEESTEEVKIKPTDPLIARVRRSLRVRSNSELNKMKIDSLAKFAVDTLDEFDSDNSKRVVLDILSASKEYQSPNVMYFLKLKVGFTKCDELNPNSKKCDELNPNSKIKTCYVEIEVKPNGDKKVVKSHCLTKDYPVKRSRRFIKRNLLGGPKPVDLSDPIINDLAKQSLYKFDVSKSSGNHHKIIRLISATKQVVSGILTKINFEVKRSNCSRSDVDNDEICDYLDESRVKICNASVWDRAWLDNPRQIEINCESPKVTELDHIKELEKFIADGKLFDKFLTKYRKSYVYDTEEYRKRFGIFRKNLEKIKSLNENERGTAKYGPNVFADLSAEEFQKSYLGLRPDLFVENSIPLPMAEIPDLKDLPAAFDWRDKGAVTPVKNQGSCGSCWAFSVTGNIEGQWKIQKGNLLSLSEQELVDCDKLDEGCNGGLPDNAYRAIEELGGLELENDYPYDGEDEKCHFNKTIAKVQISGAVNISSDETDMAKWLTANGPISIGINANAMQFYMGGVSHPLKFLCSPESLDHGVLIVGYGVHEYKLFHKTMPYWIVKNSWGPSWGEKGYYRVYRGDGTCGLNLMASSSVI